MAEATIYRYRREMVWALYFIVGLYGLQVLIPGVVISTMFFTAELADFADLASFAWVFVALLAMFALLGIWLWSVVYRLAGVRICLDSGKLCYRGRWGSTIVPLDTIEQIEFSSIQYLGGYLKIVSKVKTLRITVALKDVTRFLLELKTAMDELGIRDRYDRHKYFSFYKTAAYSDESWERSEAIFWKWILPTLGIAMAAAGYLLIRETSIPSTHVVIVSIGFLLLVTAIWCLPEFYFARRVAKLSDEETFTCPPRDRDYEKAVYRKAFAIVALIGIALVMLLSSFEWSF